MTSVVNLIKFLIFACSLLLAGCFRNEAPEEIKEIKGDVFGSYYIIKYRGELDEARFKVKLASLFEDFNNQFSTYKKSSVISSFNSSAPNRPLKVSTDFIEMLELAERFYKETEGAFDPTLGPVIKLWGFGGGEVKKQPEEKELKAAIKKVGFKYIKWNKENQTVWKEIQGLQLDVNAFVPGWVCDRIGSLLETESIKNYMVDISGEIVFKGQKTVNQEWVAGIEKPSVNHAEAVQVAFKIKDLSISTSGNYRQFYDQNGKRRSHILDPRTGRPVEHSISSASVITNSGVSADAWSTAMMVLGPEGVALSEKNGIKVLLLDAKEPQNFNEITSPSMKSFLKAHQI